MENNTWELTKLPEGRRPIGSKGVFKVNYRSDRTVERFKGRLVAKGFTPTYGIDYDETFSSRPVVQFSSIRVLLVVHIDRLIHQMDVVTAFLGTLDEEMHVYMHQPGGYVVQGKEHLVCPLKKSLYGLNQAPRCWNTAFQQYMALNRVQQIHVYISNMVTVTIVAVYVDDLIIISKTAEEMRTIKKNLSARFKMKDMGRLHNCLEVNIEQDECNKCLWIH